MGSSSEMELWALGEVVPASVLVSLGNFLSFPPSLRWPLQVATLFAYVII